MKLLLDENMPIQLIPLLAGHEVLSVEAIAWKGPRNGRLLSAAVAAGFDVMVTSDKSIDHQQNRHLRIIALVVVNTNHRPSVIKGAEAIGRAIDRSKPGGLERVHVGPSRDSRSGR